MMFAEIDAQGWAVIIGAACVGIVGVLTGVGGIVTSLYTLKANARREDARIERENAAADKLAKKLEESNQKVADHVETVTVVQANQFKGIAGDLAEIHEKVNGLNEKMGAAREEKGRAEGRAETH